MDYLSQEPKYDGDATKQASQEFSQSELVHHVQS